MKALAEIPRLLFCASVVQKLFSGLNAARLLVGWLPLKLMSWSVRDAELVCGSADWILSCTNTSARQSYSGDRNNLITCVDARWEKPKKDSFVAK